MSPQDTKALEELERLKLVHERQIAVICKRMTAHLVALDRIKAKKNRIHTRNHKRKAAQE